MTTTALPALPAPQSSLGEIAVYVQALKDHDWWYSWADDNTVYQRGKRSLERITEMQKRIDAEAVLWNVTAPEAYRLHVAEAA